MCPTDMAMLRELLTFTRDGEWGEGTEKAGYTRCAVIRGTDFAAVRLGNISGLPERWIRSDIVERKRLQAKDIVIETAGGTKDQETGRTLLITSDLVAQSDAPLVCASFARSMRSDTTKVEPEYLFWVLQNAYRVGLLSKYHVQHTGVARFQFTDFAGSFEIALPDTQTQQKCARVLLALDEKIEANGWMSKALEGIARALFRSWFINFDPVRAKAEGRATGLSSDLDRLFPKSFDENGAPLGWEWAPLQSLVANVVDRCHSGPVTEGRPYVPIDAIAAKTIILPGHRSGSEAQSSLVTFHPGDVLFGAMRPYFHKVALATFEGTTRTTVFVLRAHQEADREFALFTLAADEAVAYATAHSTGSTIPYAVWGNSLDRMPTMLASPEARSAYGEIVRPLLQRAVLAAEQSRTLAGLRDLLLPKLISGTISVEDAERQLGGNL